MRLTRVAVTVAATALAPTLLLATPALASGGAGATGPAGDGVVPTAAADDELDELRVAVARILHAATEAGDRAVIRGANEALDAGTEEALRAFLETGYPAAQFEDDRVAAFRILNLAREAGDRAVEREVTEALEAGTAEALREFRETGYAVAQFEDDRVATFRILNLAREAGDRAVEREAIAALEAGTPQAVREFRETGYRLAQFEDDQVATFRILADPDTSDALRAAAEAALEEGTPEALRYFITRGQYEVDA
ncbi:Short repeat-containing protein of unknown function [Streptomyces zhaozhouensis]|uniref:SurA N-terminal domain-containing protein n=1 Tax=Streptomyces zhaozhouensis TaxID=1300267 RepID=A0A286DK52_9ACTN|nr:ALF repeat-containing protein [Streptomyces zhaozhouensis]SOD59127.1 Short repeat-containing protein of unknown function [Streptomyces zhaozhouensis]